MTAGQVPALVIGAGPAGLMAAEAIAAAGHRVVVAEAMPTPARKFLMAGKSGLNLTRDEPAAAFAARIAGGVAPVEGYLSQEDLQAIVAGFGPAEVRAWAEGLGIALFAGSTGIGSIAAVGISPAILGPEAGKMPDSDPSLADDDIRHDYGGGVFYNVGA